MMPRIPTRTVLLAALAWSLVSPTLVAAAPALRDQADFFSPDTETKVNEKLSQIQKRDGRSVVIETYPEKPPSMRSGASAEWMRQRARDQGADVIVFVTRNPSHLEIGSDVLNAAERDEARNRMLSAFRQRRFDDGLVQAIDYVDQRLAQSRSAAARADTSQSSGAPSPSSPPSPGPAGNPSRPQAIPQVGCGGGMAGLLCMILVIAGAVMLFRGMMARRAGYGGGYGPGGYPPTQPGGYPPQGGYGSGQPGYGGGGGFGRGVMGGVLGGLLGGWLMNRGSAMGSPGALGDPNAGHPEGLPPTDPSTFGDAGGFGTSGGDFGGGDSGGGGGGGGGDFGSSGGDF